MSGQSRCNCFRCDRDDGLALAITSVEEASSSPVMMNGEIIGIESVEAASCHFVLVEEKVMS